jgi:hypothetical protein
VADPACAVMIEKVVPLPKLVSIVVQCDEDQRVLQSEFDRIDLRVNYYTIKSLQTQVLTMMYDC